MIKPSVPPPIPLRTPPRSTGAPLALQARIARQYRAPPTLGAITTRPAAAPPPTRFGAANAAQPKSTAAAVRIGPAPPALIWPGRGKAAQLMEKKTGKRGLGYGNAGSGLSAARTQQIMDRAGLDGISAHGTGKSGSGESNKKKTEMKRFIDAKHEIEAEEYKASRPQPIIHGTPAKTNYDRVVEEAIRLHQAEKYSDDFDDYVQRREITDVPAATLDKIRDWLDGGHNRQSDLEAYLGEG